MSHLFAYLSRMKFIQRWSLMYNNYSENVQEHSQQVAMIAHALAVIRNRLFNGNVNVERTALLAVYHDASEVFTGDLPTPIKYFNPEIKTAYKSIESVANQKLLAMVPEALKQDFLGLFEEAESDLELHELVKAADKIAAYLKCLAELGAGNQEFAQAEKELKVTVEALGLDEVKYFLENFVPSFKLTLDELV